MMTREQATEVANLFRSLGGFTSIEAAEHGWNTGNWRVNLWAVNAAAGNRSLTVVADPVSEKEAKLIAKKARGLATARDNAALARMAAERTVNAE